MPIHSGQDKTGAFYQWGKTGKKYYYEVGNEDSRKRALNKAKKQQTAIYSSGWKGDSMKMKLIKVKTTRKMDEDAEVLNELDMMSKNLLLPAYKFPNYLVLDFDKRKVETIDKQLAKIEKTLELFNDRVQYARKYLNSVKNDVKKKQAELGNGRFLE